MKSSEKGNFFAVIASIVAVVSLAANIFFYLDTSSINEVLHVKEVCEKDCHKEKIALSRDFEQKLELRVEMERGLSAQRAELDREVKMLEKRTEELFSENMLFRGENRGLSIMVDQLKQFLASQGKMEKHIEENFTLKGKVAELNTIIKLKDGKYDGLKENMTQAKKDIFAFKKEVGTLKSTLSNEQRLTSRLKTERSQIKDVYQKLVNSHQNLKTNIVSDLERFYDSVEDAMNAKNGKRKNANERVRTKFNDSLMPRYQKQKDREVHNASYSYSSGS